jgi:hypothetical protein
MLKLENINDSFSVIHGKLVKKNDNEYENSKNIPNFHSKD